MYGFSVGPSEALELHEAAVVEPDSDWSLIMLPATGESSPVLSILSQELPVIEELKVGPNMEFGFISAEVGGKCKLIRLRGRSQRGVARSDLNLMYLPFGLRRMTTRQQPTSHTADIRVLLSNKQTIILYFFI